MLCNVLFAVLHSYKHAIDGLYRVVRDEGPVKLMNGATMASSRATLVTIGQVLMCCYLLSYDNRNAALSLVQVQSWKVQQNLFCIGHAHYAYIITWQNLIRNHSIVIFANFFQKYMTQMLVVVTQWTKLPLTGHSAWWADGLTLAGVGSNPGLEGGFQLSRSSRHAMRLNALSGILWD